MKLEGIYAVHIKHYLKLKRALGHKLRDAEYVFAQFDRLTLERKEETMGITQELAEEWCKKRPNESDNTRRVRVSFLSLFARYLRDAGFPSYEPEVPKYPKSFTPYIFTKEEIRKIISACDTLIIGKKGSDTACEIMPTLIRVLYGTGMRLGEALELKEKDVHLYEKYIIVRDTKNGQDRMLPITDSLVLACSIYLERKRKRTKHTTFDLFFIKSDGTKCAQSTAYQNFRMILHIAGIPHKGKGLGPRLHDLRHTFACHSLAQMVESGSDIYHSMPVLSTYLGHRTLESTDKYVRLTTEMFPGLTKQISDLSTYVYPKNDNEQ